MIMRIEGSLEVKLPTIWTDEKAETGRVREESQRREEEKKEDQRRESQMKEDAGARKARKVAKHGVFPMICGSRGSKSRLAEAAVCCCGAKNISKPKCTKHTNVEMWKKPTLLWYEAHVQTFCVAGAWEQNLRVL